ncbi:hypothetical protein AMJ39_00495 [candidate division TA06 bacterium DG_24]|uniref:Uncharacterized protein n=1 Tax=candidate division TA06 bacterium DG_24 TaxID=1703770 RepID=A0A0S7WW89_UNCT6|nr:MAG: hypothetical protein AMJ39_00495 [candidate division TA06 bacterium DG_24]
MKNVVIPRILRRQIGIDHHQRIGRPQVIPHPDVQTVCRNRVTLPHPAPITQRKIILRQQRIPRNLRRRAPIRTVHPIALEIGQPRHLIHRRLGELTIPQHRHTTIPGKHRDRRSNTHPHRCPPPDCHRPYTPSSHSPPGRQSHNDPHSPQARWESPHPGEIPLPRCRPA